MASKTLRASTKLPHLLYICTRLLCMKTVTMPLLIMSLWTALAFSRSPSLAQPLTMLLYTSMSHLTPCQVVAHRVDTLFNLCFAYIANIKVQLIIFHSCIASKTFRTSTKLPHLQNIFSTFNKLTSGLKLVSNYMQVHICAFNQTLRVGTP